MRTPRNIVRHELIGLKARIADSSDSEAVGTEGRVIDETRNMLVMETRAGGERSFPKEQCVFSFYLPETREWVRIDGKVIVARPEDRIKKKLSRW